MAGQRIIKLEACRGIAALIVVVYHIILTFRPELLIRFSSSVLFVFINGTTAVAFFFVLSGFVLSVHFFAAPNHERMGRAAFKRLPRLALLTTIVTIISALLWIFGFYRFGFGEPASLADFHPSLFSAIKEGAWQTFMRGDHSYDSSLWTMVYEFRGSLLVFAVAPFLVYVLDRKLAWLALPSLIVIFHYADQHMIFFICGVSIAFYEKHLLRMASWPLTFALLSIGLYLLSYWVTDGNDPSTVIVFAWAAGASFVIIAVLQSATAEKLLDNRVGKALGLLSFPIYLVHVPIIWSTGSWVYATGDHRGAAAVVIVLTLIVAWPLAILDLIWVRFLNRQFSAIFTASKILT